ncbi:MAG: UbiA family prenyltransferase [Bacteroidia bacterium]
MKAIKLAAYFKERFPPVNMLLFVILFAAVQSVAQSDFDISWIAVWGALACISFFFRLRVMDEIKDFDTDAALHPNRVLQSGGISLKFLVLLSAALSLMEMAWSYQMGAQALGWWFLALGYSLLMRYEFFIGTWLRKSLLLYAISHMLIMPLAIGWIWFGFRDDLNLNLLLLMALSLVAGFSFEIARKTHAADAEREGLDSYSKQLGLPHAVYTILALQGLGLVLQLLLFSWLELSWWTYPLPVLIYLVLLLNYRKALKSSQNQYYRRAELFCSLAMLLSYLILIVGCWL